MSIKLEDSNLIIPLNELEKRVLERAYPAVAPFVEMMARTALFISFRMLQVDKGAYREGKRRIEAGENGSVVMKDLLGEMSIPDSLAKIMESFPGGDLEDYLKEGSE
jgi:hypothetical protein